MKAEGIKLDEEELLYMLKEKSGLSPYRRQMLDTFLGSGTDYGATEAAIVRLFGMMHTHARVPRTSERSTNVATSDGVMWDLKD